MAVLRKFKMFLSTVQGAAKGRRVSMLERQLAETLEPELLNQVRWRR